MLGNGGSFYRNFTGCGNTINGNHPIVREMMFFCLRHWVQNYHIDGFRFDLASILSRDRNGEIIPNPPVVEMIAEDPLLGRHQNDRRSLGRRRRVSGRLVRQLALGRMERALSRRRAAVLARRSRTCSATWPRGWPARAICIRPAGGSRITASTSSPRTTAFTLNDLVSYADKHNEDNDEGNRDGDNNNYSANYGVEGPTRKKNIEHDSPAADQELAGHAVAEPGRADAAGRRRMPPHAARQQQRLLPGQSDFLVRLEAGRKESGIWFGS